MGSVVLCVPTPVDGTGIIRATLGGVGVSTLGGADSLTLSYGDVCTTLGGAPYFIKAGLKQDFKLP